MIRDVANATTSSAPGPDEIVIRVAQTSEEIRAAGEIVDAAYLADGFSDEPYRAVLRDAQTRAEQATLLVAVDQAGAGRVVGSVTFAVQGQPLAQVARSGEAEFRMLGVDPSARGRGVGRALVEACCERARAHGSVALVLCTSTDMHAAQRMYARMGFVRDAERDWKPSEKTTLMGFVLPL
jgi:ribosomal protein S18 acetylase RimI-like enzyme